MNRVNLRLLAVLIILLLAGGAGVYALHRYQVHRNARTMASLADERLAAGQEDEAVDLLARYVAMRPEDLARQRQYAELLLGRIDSGKATPRSVSLAKGMMERAVRAAPDDDLLREKLADLLLRTGDLSGSYDNYSMILAHLDAPERASPAGEGDGERPDRGRIALLCAALGAQLGRFDEAEARLSQLIGFDPATKQFAAGAVSEPEYAAAYPSLARIMEKHRRDPQTATRIMARLAADHPERAEAVKFLAVWGLEHGDLDAAEAAVAKARALDPEDTDAAFLELQLALARKDDDRAQALLDGPLAAVAQTPAIVVNRASLMQRRGDVEGRVRVLREALEANPSQALFRGELILALAEARKHDDLRRLLAESRPLLPPDAEVVIYAESVLEMAEHHWLPALRLLEKLRPLVAADAAFTRRVDLALSTCHGALGQLDQAADARSRALENVSGSRVARFAEMQTLEQTGRSAEALAIAEALATEMGGERLAAVRELWQPLFRLRVLEQMRRPKAERDWSDVDALLAGVAAHPDHDPVLLERLRIDLVAARENNEAALEASARALAEHPTFEPLVAQRVMLLASAGRAEESRETLAGLPEAIRDSADVIEAELRLAAVAPRGEATRWLDDVASRMDRLDDADADRVAKQLIAIHVGRGSTAEAEKIARRSLGRNQDHLPVRLVLLDLVAERNDVAAVEDQVNAIWRIAGRESATGRYAEAVQRIVAVRAGRDSRAPRGDTAPLDAQATASLGLARGLLVEAARDRPRWGDVPRAMAAIAELQGDKSAAIGSLRQAVELGEVLPFGRRRLVLLLASAGRLEEAVPVIVSLGDAGGPAVDRLRAEAMAIAGKTEEAVAAAAALTPDDCTDADQLLWQASLLARCQRFAEAENAARRAIAAAPLLTTSWSTLVGVQVAAGDTAAALATAEEARRALADTERERFESLVDGMIGDPESIEQRYRDAVAEAPDDPAASRRLAEALLRQQKRAEAQEELRRLVTLPAAAGTPTQSWARRMLAKQLVTTGLYRDFAEALSLLEANVDAEGKQLSEDVATSIVLLVNRDEPSSWRRSIALFDELAKRRPLTIDERVGLARVQARLGPRAKARDELVAIASSPNSSIGVVTSLVDLLLEDGDTRGAARWVARLRETVPDSPSTIRLEAKLALAEGQRDRAAALAASLIPEEPLTPANAARLLQGAALAEQIGFPEAGDRVLGEYAALSAPGAILRAASLGRRQRTAEALDLAAGVAGKVSPMAFLDAVTTIVRHSTGELPAETIARIEDWIVKTRRENPGAAEVAIQAAILEDALGLSEAAERSYRALLADDSISPVQRGVVAANLAWILARPESADEAADLVDRAVQTLGPLPDVLDTRALVRLAKGQTNLALDDMREAVIVPTALKYLHLAAAHVAASDIEAARAAFARSKALGLGNERLDERDVRRIETLESALALSGGKS